MQTGGATWWSTDQKGGKTRVNFPPKPCDLGPASSTHSPRPGTLVTSPSTQRGCGICSGSPSSNGMVSDLKADPLAFQSLLCPTLGALQKSSAIIALIFGQGSLDPLLFPVFASACSPQDLCTGSSLTCSDSVVAGLNLPSNLSTDVTSYRAHTHTHRPKDHITLVIIYREVFSPMLRLPAP